MRKVIIAIAAMCATGCSSVTKTVEVPKVDTVDHFQKSLDSSIAEHNKWMDLESHYANSALNYWDTAMQYHFKGNRKKSAKYWAKFLLYKDSIEIHKS